MRTRKVIGFAGILFLTSCGGGGPGGVPASFNTAASVSVADNGTALATSVDDPLVGSTVVSGQILDAITDSAIPGVAVRLLNGATDNNGAVNVGSDIAGTTSMADGSFAIGDIATGERYSVVFEADGYKNERYTDLMVQSENPVLLDPVRLVSEDNIGAGQLGGRIVRADDQSGIANLSLNFRAGINRRSGDVIAETRTAADGSYQTGDLEYGNVTVEINGDGVRTSYATFQVLGNIFSVDQNVSVPADDQPGDTIDAGSLRIVLTWDTQPRDLDAHLTGPGSNGRDWFHVFSGNRTADAASLVNDSTSGSGPETIEIDQVASDIYRYTVFNFSGDVDRPLELSSARVEVFSGDASLAEFAVPAGAGNLWTVFDIDQGQIVAVNTVSQLQNILDYFPPQAREQVFSGAVANRMLRTGAYVK